MNNTRAEERRLRSQMRFAATVRQIDNRAITLREETIRDRLTVLTLKRGLTQMEGKAA